MPYDRTGAHGGRDSPDALFGSITLVLAMVAIANLKGAPFGPPGRLSEWLLPASAAGLLGVVSLGLILRGMLRGPGRVERWRPRDLLIVAALVVGLVFAWQRWGQAMSLNLGPSELVTMMICTLSIAVAIARLSRLRAFAMVLVGLLLAAVGTDIATGEARFTMGRNDDGIDGGILRLGLLVAADGLLCVASPAIYLESYARWVVGWFDSSNLDECRGWAAIRGGSGRRCGVPWCVHSEQRRVGCWRPPRLRRIWRCLQAGRRKPPGTGPGVRIWPIR